MSSAFMSTTIGPMATPIRGSRPLTRCEKTPKGRFCTGNSLSSAPATQDVSLVAIMTDRVNRGKPSFRERRCAEAVEDDELTNHQNCASQFSSCHVTYDFPWALEEEIEI